LHPPTRYATIPIMLPKGWDRRTVVLLAFALLFVIAQDLAQVQVRAQGSELNGRFIPSFRWEEGTAQINGGWRTHAGDQMLWAAPDFDDSSWPISTLGESHPPTVGKNDLRWYRLRIELPPEHPDLALLVTGIEGSYEVFLNGRRLSGAEFRSRWSLTWPTAQVIPIDAAGPAVIALRTRVPNSSIFSGGSSAFRVSLGTPVALGDSARLEQRGRLNSVVLSFGIHVLLVFAALPLILLSRFQRDHREYLWIGLNLFFLATAQIAWLAVWEYAPAWLFIFCGLPSVYFSTISQIEFTFSFAGRRVTRPWRVYQAVLLLASLLLPTLMWNGILGFFVYQPIEAACIFPASITLPILLLVWYRGGNREAGWLILPSLLPLFAICMIDLGIIGMGVGSRWLRSLSDPIPIGSLTFGLSDPANLFYMLSIGIVIFLRFNRVSHQEARAAAEIAAARAVQQVLVPAENPSISGFAIETVYRPASEVGGDFFQIIPASQGGVLVCIGDVSGKGMPAAMTVSLLVGTFRTLAHYTQNPAEILTAMNQRMLSRSKDGFTTCMVLRIDRGGSGTLANAGHLAPYLGAQEFPVESGLPLGLAAEAVYTESSFDLNAGQEFTFLTDGVAEARAKTGELFGFERTASISILSAEHIAATAKAFGQQDDITVLKIRRGPVEPAVSPISDALSSIENSASQSAGPS
jgi:sigma-B regulation protein RsbU (phosphoserine phosphatase)